MLLATLALVTTVLVAAGGDKELRFQFLGHCFQLLREVSPNHELEDRQYERTLRVQLGKAKRLQAEYHQLKQRGLRTQAEREELLKEARGLLEKTFDETEVYLETQLKALKEHRRHMIDRLLPEATKPKP